MFNNVNAKKRLTQVMVAFVIICMTLTGSFLLLDDSINTVQAEDRTVSTEGQWNSVMDEIRNAGGGTWDVTLGENISVQSNQLTAVPAGATVNLIMNNKSITKNDTGSGNNNIMSTSYPFANTYWGLITNNGTLNIQGNGTITYNHIRTGYNNGGKRDNYGVKQVAIVNNGIMTIEAGITVKSYACMSHEDGTSFQDMFVYALGIYNTNGTLTTSGTIKAGAFSQGVVGTGTNSWANAFSYGIYGGNVTVNGGNIYSEAKSGFTNDLSWGVIPKKGNKAHNYAFGIFSNNAVITGKTAITTKATSWRCNEEDDNLWSDGDNMSWGIGVMYYGTNYPVIGPGVNINASYQLAASSTTISFPEYDTAVGSWTRSSSNGPKNYGRHAYAVAKSYVDITTAAMYGAQGSETSAPDAVGAGVSTAPTAGEYRTEYAWRNGLSDRVSSTDNKSATGSNDNGTQTSNIVNGASGTGGTQFMVMYRYYKGTQTAANLTSVSYSFDPNIVGSEDRAVVKVNSSETNTGLVPGVDNKVGYSKGATPENPYYYEFVNKSHETLTPAKYYSRNINIPGEWSGGSVLQNEGNAPGAGNMIIVYMDYVIKNATPINVVVADAGTPITEYTETTAFKASYTGAPLVPGTDFNIGIRDSYDNDKVITNVYNISGSGSGSGNNATAVTYRYSSDGVNWNNGLPKDVGTYKIEVNVNADTTYAASGTYNRQGKQQLIDCEITPAKVSISRADGNVITGTYGATYNDLFNSFKDFTLTLSNGNALPAGVTGAWSIQGANLTAIPVAKTHTVTIVWTPDSANIKNYGTATYTVSLVVNTRAVTVNAGTATVTYGDAAPSFKLSYNNLAAADESKQAGWLASTVFEVNYNGTWREYYQGLPAGTYDLRIKADGFGGASDTNNTFTLNTATDKLTVEKRAIKYTATATNKTYDGQLSVAVTLSNPTNNYAPDVFAATINTTGTMVNADAGEKKAVNVDISKVSIDHSSNYYLVIVNASSLTVDIAKYTPTTADVSVVANVASITYGDAATLAEVGLKEVNTKIPGTWNWKTADAKPTVGQSSYVAEFKPTNTTNYNVVYQNVNLAVDPADVEVTVAPLTVTYGDPVPVLKIAYNGFVFGESLDNIDYEGNAEVSTDYTPGSGVDKTYTISVKSTLSAENYNFVIKNSTITVKAKALTVTAKDAQITYGDPAPIFSAADVTVTGLYSGDTLASISESVYVGTNYIAGTVTGAVGEEYKINPNVVLKTNNYTITPVSGTLTVKKAVLKVTPNPKTVTFGADIPEYATAGTDYTVTGFKNGDTLARVAITGEPVFTTTYTSESSVNSYPVEAVTTNMSSANYTFTGASSSITVIKADPSITTAPTASVVNSHPLADAAFDNSAVVVNPNDSSVKVAGAFTFVNSSVVPAWGSTASYEATFTPNDIVNYNTVKVNITVTVTVKNISGTPVIQGSAMAGKTLTVSLASMDPNASEAYTYQWYANGTAISGATGATYAVKESDIGSKIYVVLDAVEANGFTGVATSAETEKVIKALLETTAKQLKVVFGGVEYTNLGVDTVFADVEYDAMPHAGTVAIADGYNANYFGTPVLKYNGSDKAPTKAGTYVVTVDVSTPDEPAGGYPENTYYGPATGIVVGKLTITRAPYIVTVFANDKPYDGTVNATATITGSPLKDPTEVVYLSADSARYSFADANAGKDKPIIVSKVTLLGDDAPNYEVVIEETTASILPRVIYFRANGVDKFYDKSNSVGVTFEYDTIENPKNPDWGYASVDNASKIYLTNGTAVATDVNAGEGIIISAIEWDPAGSSAENYEVRISNENSATVTINKAPVSVVSPVINGVTYDKGSTLATLNKELEKFDTDDGYWLFDNEDIIPTVKQKTYAATYYSSNTNYEDKTPGTVTINVSPKEVILTADSKTVTYGANAPTYTISADGFTGGDTLAMIGGNITVTSSYVPGSDIDNIYDITIKESLTRDNYTFVTVKGFLTVTPRVLNVTATAKDKVYDGSSNITVEFSKLTVDAGVFANDLGKVSLSYSSVTGTAKTADAGTTTVNYTKPVLLGEKAKNYQLNITPNAGVLTVVISKADVYGVEFPSDATVEFGYDLSYVVFGEPGVGDGTFAYENAKQVVPGALGVHDGYKVIFTPTDAKNYNTQEAIVSLQVIKCVLDYTVGIAGNPQSGQTLTVVATNLPAAALSYMTYQWYRVTDSGEYIAIKGATDKSYVATDDDVGYALAVRTAVIEGSPFVYAEGADTEEIGDVMGFVGKTTEAIKEITLTFWQRLMNWLYRILAILTGIQLGGGLGG